MKKIEAIDYFEDETEYCFIQGNNIIQRFDNPISAAIYLKDWENNSKLGELFPYNFVQIKPQRLVRRNYLPDETIL